jgi:hypothetical protein
MKNLADLSREELLLLLDVYAKNWLAHDGSWFLAAEEKYGMEAVLDLDARSWGRFAVAEAKRIMKAFAIPPNAGLQALATALQYRMYAAINRQEIEWVDEKTMIFKMVGCRVQQTRRQKDLPDFPCKSVGLVEFSHFASAVDPHVKNSGKSEAR